MGGQPFQGHIIGPKHDERPLTNCFGSPDAVGARERGGPGTRFPTHQPVPHETRVAWGKEPEHTGGHTKQNGSKPPLYVGYDPQVFLHRTQLQDRVDTPKPTHRNSQQEHGKI